MKPVHLFTLWMVVCSVSGLQAATQPAVNQGTNGPGLRSILKKHWGLDLNRDLRNPMPAEGSPAALFQRVDPTKPVNFKLVLTRRTEGLVAGGWYPQTDSDGKPTSDVISVQRQLWDFSATSKPADDADQLPALAPSSGQTHFDPGNQTFGLWVGVDEPLPVVIYSEPAKNPVLHKPFKAQPYKAMIYPNVDAKHDRGIPHSYLIAWECGLDDDFQDVLTVVDNVLLMPTDPPLPGILAGDARMRKLAGGYKFVEGPAWNPVDQALYFTNIPDSQIVRFKDQQAGVFKSDSGEANGLMFDRQGALVACEGGSRQLTLTPTGGKPAVWAARFEGKRLNSPNDLWLDAHGGVYFTDPHYGSGEHLELDKEAVYYVTAQGQVTRVIDQLIRPNGIALSHDGRYLYVVDNDAHTLHRYPVTSPGRIGPGERIAFVTAPDGMTIDARNRLYITCYGGIYVLAGDGGWLGMIPTPEWPANCTFGGKEWNVLFITARTSLYAIDTQTRGWHVHLDGVPPTQPAER